MNSQLTPGDPHRGSTSRITIIAYGTRGDVQPMIALGVALRAAGHSVRLHAGKTFRGWIEGHGLEAAPARVDVEALMSSETGRRWVYSGHNPIVMQRLMRSLIDEVAAEQIEDSWEACRDADLIVSSALTDVYAITIGEKLQVPVANALLQPAMIATCDGRVMSDAPFPDRESQLNKWFGRLLLEPFVWRMFRPHVNRFRRHIGLQPQSGATVAAARREMTTLHAVSRYVIPRPKDWPTNFHVTGYWFLADEQTWEPPDALLSFLAAGPPPVAIGFGSMTGLDPGGTARVVADAVERSGQRAVLLTGWGGIGLASLPPSMFAIPDVPHEWLFPRVAATVHHGGAGTTAAALRAGKPTVVVPHMADQPYWARRVHALGAGPRPLPRHKLTSASLAEALREAVTDAEMRRKASGLGALIRAEVGPANAVEILSPIFASRRADALGIGRVP